MRPGQVRVRRVSDEASAADGAAADEEPGGGEDACWLRRVCPGCGALADQDPPTDCPRCGARLDG